MSHNVNDPSPPSSMENDSHHDAHVHGLRLVLGSILAPKRPTPPSHTGSHPVSGTASPFQHWHYPSTAGNVGSSSGQDTPPLPSPQPHTSPVVPLYHQQHHQPPYQHTHHSAPTPHPHQYHSHVHPQPQSHTHAPAYGHSRLSYTHSTSSTPSESLSPSPTPSPRLATPPLLDHAPHGYAHESAVSDSGMIKTAMGASADAAADAKRAHFLTTLQSKSAWDAMIHGSWV